jgi:hypothetical protein
VKKNKRITSLFIYLITGCCAIYAQNTQCYSDIINESLSGLRLIDKQWEQSSFVSFGEESVTCVRQVENGFVAITNVDTCFFASFYFYHISNNGEILSRYRLSNANFSIDNKNNFIEKDGVVHYFINRRESKEFVYDLKRMKHSVAHDFIINWDAINQWDSVCSYTSPSGKYSVEIRDVSLIFRNVNKNELDTLITLSDDCTMSFGRGAWSTKKNKFYFNNWGAVSCIWEVDFRKNTLAKIVPELRAKNPICFIDNGIDKVMYCLGHRLMVAH